MVCVGEWGRGGGVCVLVVSVWLVLFVCFRLVGCMCVCMCVCVCVQVGGWWMSVYVCMYVCEYE